MCLLIVKPAGLTIPVEYLDNAVIQHPHGIGCAYADNGKVSITKNPNGDVNELVYLLEEIKHLPALVHFRYATHGSVSLANTHPFELPHGFAAAHNGIFHNVKTEGDESDTRAFLRTYIAPRIVSGTIASDTKIIEALVSGSKLALLSPAGEQTIYGEKSGTWKDGVWYSNESAFSDEYEYDFHHLDGGEFFTGYCVSCGEDVPGEFVCDYCYEYYRERYSLTADAIYKLAEYGELPEIKGYRRF